MSACSNSGRTDAHAALASFIDTYFQKYFDFNPSEATSDGLHEYDSKLEERSGIRVQNRMTELDGQAAQIAEIRKRDLNADDAIDALLVENRIQAELLDLRTIKTWRTPLYYAGIPGNAVDLLMKRDFAPAAARLAAVTARLEQIPALIDAMQDNLLEPPREFTDLAIRIVQGSIPFFRDSVAEWARSAAGRDQ
ncbi:MAG: DUF885 family protein, partial [Acidobacteriaceae bacterium]|nr:DUF885 family protein [Acidobacteriaceae bacterium]